MKAITIARLGLVSALLLATGCPTSVPRDRVEVAPGIYEDTLLSELSERQQEAVCTAMRDSCMVATPGEEPYVCANGLVGCSRADALSVNDELPTRTCLLNMRFRIERNGPDCTATVGDWMRCDRDRWVQCQTAPGEWTLPSCEPVNCR
jgi:hypothetical protein